MRVIVCGSRHWDDRERIAARLFDLSLVTDNLDCTIVHGACRGADRIAAQEAQKIGLLVEPHPADWDRFGKRAGYVRNAEMAAAGADLCIAFWDGLSEGTGHMMRLALEQGIPVEVVGVDR